MRTFLSSKIHKATVTQADLSYVGSVTIDEALMEAAGISEWEQIHIVDNTNGARIVTYVIRGERNSGIIGINGAAAHLIHEGDEVILMTYAMAEEPSEPTCILVDRENKFVRYLTETAGQTISSF